MADKTGTGFQINCKDSTPNKIQYGTSSFKKNFEGGSEMSKFIFVMKVLRLRNS